MVRMRRNMYFLNESRAKVVPIKARSYPKMLAPKEATAARM